LTNTKTMVIFYEIAVGIYLSSIIQYFQGVGNTIYVTT